MKQTAVEWLVKELTKNKFITKNGGFTNPLIEQAKEMEKQQIIDAQENGQSIIKTEKDAKIFIEALENIPEPNEKLKKAFKDFHKKETTLEEAKKYLSNEGYGTGSNFTLNNVANLMIKWQQEQNKKN